MTSSQIEIAIPGQDLGSISKYIPGPGTHVFNSHIYASLPGILSVSKPPKPAGPSKRLTKITAPEPASLPIVSVVRPSLISTDGEVAAAQEGGNTIGDSVGGGTISNGRNNKKIEAIPEVNSTVLCKVTRIMPRQATVAIMVVGETVLEGEWQGIIRVQDVRATEKDRVRIFESFRPGDVVRAIVISLGDQSSYYLSTASNNLGVIMATSEAGNAMYPVSWKEYRDPETGLSESRKVAKPF